MQTQNYKKYIIKYNNCNNKNNINATKNNKKKGGERRKKLRLSYIIEFTKQK